MSSENLNEFVKIGAAWIKSGRDGRRFLSLSNKLGGRSQVLMPNTFKKPGSNEPDYILYLMPLPDDLRGGGDDLLGTGNGLVPYDDGLEVPGGELPPPPFEEPAPARTQPAPRARQSQSYHAPRAQDQRGGTNGFLGGRGEAVRRSQPAPTDGDELTDPFAE